MPGGRAKSIAGTIQKASELDQQWMRNPAGRDSAACTPWMPFPMFDFIALVAEALPGAPGERFLEAGCGIGTRMLLAQVIFGLDVAGFDRVPEYVHEAQKLGLAARCEDAAGYDGYGDADIVWFNRPFRDRVPQADLEQKVWNEMKPGAVVICANLEGRPPQDWWLVLDDMEVRRGIWQKP